VSSSLRDEGGRLIRVAVRSLIGRWSKEESVTFGFSVGR
jgi:hypothetical protein